MRRTIMFIATTLAVAGLALPATAAPPPGFPPSSPPGQSGEPPAPPRGNPGTPSELSIDDVSVAEGAQATLTVTASTAPTQDVTVDWATQDGSATVGDGDYVGAGGVATIAKGTRSTTVTVDILDDTVDDDGESFVVVLSNASTAATIADGAGTVSIVDDDEPPVVHCDGPGDPLPWPAQPGDSTGTQAIVAPGGHCDHPMLDMPIGATARVEVRSADFGSLTPLLVVDLFAAAAQPLMEGDTQVGWVMTGTRQTDDSVFLEVFNDAAVPVDYVAVVVNATGGA